MPMESPGETTATPGKLGCSSSRLKSPSPAAAAGWQFNRLLLARVLARKVSNYKGHT